MQVKWSSQIHRAEGAKGFLVMPTGEVLATRTEGGPEGVHVILSRSGDGGRSWQRLSIIVSDPDTAADIGDGNLCLRRSGELLYVYRHHRYRGEYAQKPHYSIRVATSKDGGKSWAMHSTVFEVHPVGEGPSRGLWAPFLFETRRGVLQCYYDDEYTPWREGFSGHQWVRMHTWNPKTQQWQNPVTVSRAHHPVHLSRDGMPSVVELSNERLLCVLESVQTFPPHAGVIRCVESRDGGRTWSWTREERRVVYQPRDTRFMALAPWVTKVLGDHLLCVFVTDEDRVAPDKPGTPPPSLNMDVKYVWSADGGKTWSQPAETVYAETHKCYMPGVGVLKQDHQKAEILVLFLETQRGYFARRGVVRRD
jgi:hypothetical protein